MTVLLSLLISGLSLGAMYALIALGFVVLYRSSDVLNFAQGSFVIFGAYIIVVVRPHLGFWSAVGCGVLGTAALGLAVERGLVRHLRSAPLVSLALLTIGLDTILQTFLGDRIGADVRNVGQPWANTVLRFGSINVPENRAIGLLCAVVIVAVLFATFRYTSWGVALRAVAEDGEAAELVGIRMSAVTASTWALAGALAAVAAVFLTGSPTPGLTTSVSSVALRAFPAAVLGGLDSVGGAVAGGLIIGVAESLTDGYSTHLSFLGAGIGDVMPYIVMIIVLIARPSGLAGTREAIRV